MVVARKTYLAHSPPNLCTHKQHTFSRGYPTRSFCLVPRADRPANPPPPPTQPFPPPTPLTTSLQPASSSRNSILTKVISPSLSISHGWNFAKHLIPSRFCSQPRPFASITCRCLGLQQAREGFCELSRQLRTPESGLSSPWYTAFSVGGRSIPLRTCARCSRRSKSTRAVWNRLHTSQAIN